MEVLFGTSSDIEQSRKLVKRVSWNFPGLETEESIEEHLQTVLRFMNKKQNLLKNLVIQIKNLFYIHKFWCALPECVKPQVICSY